GTSLVNPSVYLRPTAQPTSSSPATINSTHAMRSPSSRKQSLVLALMLVESRAPPPRRRSAAVGRPAPTDRPRRPIMQASDMPHPASRHAAPAARKVLSDSTMSVPARYPRGHGSRAGMPDPPTRALEISR